MIKNLIGNSRGCGCLLFLIILAIAFVAWQIEAQTVTTAYIQYVTYRPNVGIAWLSGTQEDVTALGAYYHYACCSACPEPGGAKIPVLRPGAYWADCPADYDGYLLVGNEGEFGGQDDMTPTQMAQFITNARAEHPKAIFVCLNSYLIDYMLDVIALLPPGTCQVYGVHVYSDVDIADHLAPLQGYRLWVTEIGACGHGAYERLKRQVEEARRYGAERIFGYTAVGGVASCLDMLDNNGSLTPPGLGFVAGLRGYP